MHITDYMHCMPRALPSERTEDQIQACETCVSRAELQYYVNLWAPTLGVDIVEGFAAYCLFHVGPPGWVIGGGLIGEGLTSTGCAIAVSIEISETASNASEACEKGLRSFIQDDLGFSPTQAEEGQGG